MGNKKANTLAEKGKKESKLTKQKAKKHTKIQFFQLLQAPAFWLVKIKSYELNGPNAH